MAFFWLVIRLKCLFDDLKEQVIEYLRQMHYDLGLLDFEEWTLVKIFGQKPVFDQEVLLLL